ncbi:MAG: response regulator transcription factor [Bacteroidales bacterium]|nr:response regulator transcription factor [Bacteroidales bacterium]
MIIVVLTVYEDQMLINRVKEFNANAYLSKDASIEDLKKVIFSSHSDSFFVSASIQNKLFESIPEFFDDSFSNVGLLTLREKEIIALIVKGKSTESISRELFISFNTVKTHKKNIFSKLKMNKVPELVKFAYENNLI